MRAVPARPGLRPLPLRPLLAEGGPALALLAAMLLERARAAPEIGPRMPAAVLLALVLAGAVAARRRAPFAAYLVGTAALAAESLLVLASPVSPYANLVGVHALGLYATRSRARLGPLAVLLGMAGYFAGEARTYPVVPVGALALWLAIWALGYGTARRQDEQDARRLLAAERIAAEERARIARDVHDLLGHSLSLMLVQAGAARRLLDRDPGRTRDLLRDVEATGGQALGELDRVLGLLRRADPDAGTPAEPGLAELPGLLDRIARAGGPRITARIDPATRTLPATVDRCAYRIVQEALTNTVRHAHATTVDVVVGHDPDRLTLEIDDDGRGTPDGYHPGRGLLGIAERVALLAGRVEHGPGERGFRLRAVLPLR
ncbi:sensor histidine kinase [Kitasatospora sp. NPDC048365]|uniref:sensor histidine kinase n=1 Tax=Kitasatospora sp. NPDC048365 TaxID=3364050 RepID=UPI0037169526